MTFGKDGKYHDFQYAFEDSRISLCQITSLELDTSTSNSYFDEPSPTLWRKYGSSSSQSASRTILACWREEQTIVNVLSCISM